MNKGWNALLCAGILAGCGIGEIDTPGVSAPSEPEAEGTSSQALNAFWGKISSCVIAISECPAHPQYGGPGKYFADTYDGADKSVSRCLRRAAEYKSWCKTNGYLQAVAYDGSGKAIRGFAIPAGARASEGKYQCFAPEKLDPVVGDCIHACGPHATQVREGVCTCRSPYAGFPYYPHSCVKTVADLIIDQTTWGIAPF